MPLLLRAIISGFGYKLGVELARRFSTRIGLIEPEQARKEQKAEDVPDGLTTQMPLDDDDPDASDRDDDDDDEDEA